MIKNTSNNYCWQNSNPEPELFIQGQDHIEWNSSEEYYLSNGKPVNIIANVQSKVKIYL